MGSPEIDKRLEDARREVVRRSPRVWPTVVASAVVLRAARFLRRHAELGADGRLAAWAEALEQVGLVLSDGRPETLPAAGRPGARTAPPPLVP